MAKLAKILLLMVLSWPGFAAEPMRKWTARNGSEVEAAYVSIRGNIVTLRTAEGKPLAIPLANLSEADVAHLEGLGVVKIPKPRTWTTTAGKTTQAVFSGLSSGKVTLTGEDGRRIQADLANLSLADRQHVFYQAPVPLEEWLYGDWRGWGNEGDSVFQFTVSIRKPPVAGMPVKTKMFIRVGLTREQLDLASAKKLAATDVQTPTATQATVQDVTVSIKDGEVVFKGLDVDEVFKASRTIPWVNADWKATIHPGGYLSGTRPSRYYPSLDKSIDSPGEFYAVRSDLPETPLPLDLEKGKVHSRSIGEWTYSLYIPKSYDPSRPAPLLINDSPSGKAGPFHSGMAEELGWIMAGLGQSRNDYDSFFCNANSNAALFDMERLLHLDQGRFYFTGFSGGSRRASIRAWSFPDQTAGLLSIGAVFTGGYYPLKSLPIFFIAGASDMNNKEVVKVHGREKAAGRPCEIIVHPGGHTWGRPEDHVAALRWLNAQWKEAPAAKPAARKP